MAVMEVTLQSTYVGQECINRFNYISQGVGAAVTDSYALAYAMGFVTVAGSYPAGTLFAAIRAAQVPGVVYDFATIRDVYSDTDFYELPFVVTAAGTDGSAGEGNSPFVALGFRTNRVRASIRRGTKRFTGIGESRVGGGGTLVAGYATIVSTLETKLAQVLSFDDEGNTITFTPCICGKESYETPSGKRAYKYYDTEAEQLDHTATGVAWTAYTEVRTQTSRQYGRGR